MKKTIVFLLSVCVILLGCTAVPEETKPPVNSGMSDGTVYFTEGNINFTIPDGHFYVISTAKEESSSLSLVYLDGTNVKCSIYSVDSSEKEETKLIKEFPDWAGIWDDHYKSYVRMDDVFMDIMGKPAVFHTYIENAEDPNPKLYMICSFTDSYFSYNIDITLNEISEDCYTPLIEMISFSEYIGPEQRFDYFQNN